MTLDDALARDVLNPCQMSTYCATGTDGERWFQALRSQGYAEVSYYELFFACGRLRTEPLPGPPETEAEIDWLPGHLDPPPGYVGIVPPGWEERHRATLEWMRKKGWL